MQTALIDEAKKPSSVFQSLGSISNVKTWCFLLVESFISFPNFKAYHFLGSSCSSGQLDKAFLYIMGLLYVFFNSLPRSGQWIQGRVFFLQTLLLVPFCLCRYSDHVHLFPVTLLTALSHSCRYSDHIHRFPFLQICWTNSLIPTPTDDMNTPTHPLFHRCSAHTRTPPLIHILWLHPLPLTPMKNT